MRVSYSSTPSTDESRFLSLLTQIDHDFGYQILRFFAVTNPALRELGNSLNRPAAYEFYDIDESTSDEEGLSLQFSS